MKRFARDSHVRRNLPTSPLVPSLAAMPDRLVELRRQRALVQEHLAWLDREIVAAENAPSAPAAATAVRDARPGPSAAPVAVARTGNLAPVAAPSPDAILEEYAVAPGTVKSEVRKGCLLYFVAALALLVLVIAVLYFALSSR